MSKLTIVGGGLSGLVAAITAAERGAEVELFEARKSLAGRARTKSGDFTAAEKAVGLLRSQSCRRRAAAAGQA